MYKIKVDQEACVGCGACTVCENFEMQNDGKARAIESEVEEIGCNQDAEDMCPVQAIKIEKE
ncbi:ferredoxin [Candidatus Woesearchaeota archaeon]|nr:ferredoxin [Candidatus Woesearchaeota archaeon]